MNYLIHLTNDEHISETLEQRFDRIYQSKASQTGGVNKEEGPGTGNRSRTLTESNNNSESSRSHCLVQVRLDQR